MMKRPSTCGGEKKTIGEVYMTATMPPKKLSMPNIWCIKLRTIKMAFVIFKSGSLYLTIYKVMCNFGKYMELFVFAR